MRCLETSKGGIFIAVLVTVAAGPRAGAQEVTSSAESRHEVTLTVYSGDLALVRESRSVETREGTFLLRYMDVTTGINPASVSLAARGGHELRILEQSYEYDLISKKRLMDRYVGRTVGYRAEDGSSGTATLLSTHEGYVFDLGGKIVFELPGDIVLDALPDGLSARPTLVWMLDGERRGSQDVEVSYLTSGMDWHADYVLRLDASETTGHLSAWVTVENRTGVPFDNAQLRVVAGDVQRVREMMLRTRAAAAPMALEQSAVAGFHGEPAFEYHVYTLQRRTDLENNQAKQVLLFQAGDVSVTRTYRFRGTHVRLSPQFSTQPAAEQVSVFLELENSEGNNLGLPIPAGIVRTYRSGSDAGPEFLGENRVDHTPKDETLEFEVGKAFDVVGEHVRTDYRRLAERAYEIAFEVKLRNHKEDAIEVIVAEEFVGDWRIVSSSLPYEKASATTATFTVPVGAGAESVLTYRAHVQP